MSDIQKRTIIFGGGCFWCTEAIFKMLKGVLSVEPGYAGGDLKKPTYDQVATGKTGHAEVIRIEYDPSIISFEDLLTVFFGTHDPTTVDRQGNDVGSEYRSVIFYTTSEERVAAETFIQDLQKTISARIVTEVKPAEMFYPAEGYHHDFYEQNKEAPYCQFIIEPKIEKVRTRFKELLKKE